MPEVLNIVGSVGTLYAALHGEFAWHPWRDGAGASDAYSLFVARSSAMGWLADAGERTCGVWGMNDAGHQPWSGSHPARVAWFQVSLAGPVPSGRPLPVQAFLSCAGDVVARMGTLRLHAVQLILPVQSIDSPVGLSLLQDAGWFADCDPRSRTRVRVTVDGGQNPAIHAAIPAMRDWIQGLDQSVFHYESYTLTGHDVLALEPPVIDELWSGPPQHRVTYGGVLAEWSLSALGWLAAFLADAGRRHGIDGPLMLTATRAGQSR